MSSSPFGTTSTPSSNPADEEYDSNSADMARCKLRYLPNTSSQFQPYVYHNAQSYEPSYWYTSGTGDIDETYADYNWLMRPVFQSESPSCYSFDDDGSQTSEDIISLSSKSATSTEMIHKEDEIGKPIHMMAEPNGSSTSKSSLWQMQTSTDVATNVHGDQAHSHPSTPPSQMSSTQQKTSHAQSTFVRPSNTAGNWKIYPGKRFGTFIIAREKPMSRREKCKCPNCRVTDGKGVRRADGKRQHVCCFPNCRKIFGSCSHLKRHLSGVHDCSVGSVTCTWPLCDRRFHDKADLQRHTRRHTRKQTFVGDVTRDVREF